jgi:hypothetical protein
MIDSKPNDLRALRTRLRGALPTLPGTEALLHYLDGLPMPERSEAGDLRVEVAVSADVQRITLSATAPASQLLTRTARFLAEADVTDAEMQHFAKACDQLEPDRLGSWLEIGPQGIDGGWLMPGPLTLEAVRAFAPEGEPHEQLMAWASDHGIETCMMIKRSVGETAAYTELLLPLPSGDARTQLEAALAGFDAVGAVGLPQGFRDAVQRHARGPMALSAWLVKDGLAKIGLMLTTPTTELQMSLLEAAGQADAELDRFMAELGEVVPQRMEIQELADGIELELYFSLGAAEPTH